MERDPCPWRMVDDAGGGFAIGLIGGSVWHFVGGYRNAPKNHGLSQAISRVQVRVPTTAGAFAVWGAIFSCFDCAITSIRHKEDPWNAILSGAATGGFLAARAGLKSMGKNALIGGVILAAMEGVGIAFQRVVMPMIEKKFSPQAQAQIDLLTPPVDPKRRIKSLYATQALMSTNYPQAAPAGVGNTLDSKPVTEESWAASSNGSTVAVAEKKPSSSWRLW